MCVQFKQRYELCPHVAYDYNVMDCKRAAHCRQCRNQETQIPDVEWSGTRHEGNCWFCELEEMDVKEKKQRYKELARKLDLFEEEEFVANKSDANVSSKEIGKSDTSGNGTMIKM